jgi:RNA polymerase sigma-70 factor (ECF subfamily)
VEGDRTTTPRPGRRRAVAGPAAGRRRTSRDDHLCDLMEAIGDQRCQAAFNELFLELAPRVRRMLLQRGLSWALTEELTQETMLAVWRHAPTFDRRRASVATWVLTIARNRQLDLHRSVTRPNQAAWEGPGPPPPAPPDGEQILHAKQSGEILHHAISTLPREQELVLRQAFGAAKSHSEIAAEQALPLGTVKSRIRLALAHLRTSLPMAELR